MTNINMISKSQGISWLSISSCGIERSLRSNFRDCTEHGGNRRDNDLNGEGKTPTELRADKGDKRQMTARWFLGCPQTADFNAFYA